MDRIDPHQLFIEHETRIDEADLFRKEILQCLMRLVLDIMFPLRRDVTRVSLLLEYLRFHSKYIIGFSLLLECLQSVGIHQYRKSHKSALSYSSYLEASMSQFRKRINVESVPQKPIPMPGNGQL